MVHLRSGVAGVLFLLIGAAGCVIVPFPAPTRTRAKGVTHKRIDLGFLKVGATTRADVMREVGDFATDAAGESFLWCRWEESRAGVAGGVGGVGGAATAAGRIWSKKNLLARFDAKGTLTDYRLPADEELVATLISVIKETNHALPDGAELFRLDFRYPKRTFLGEERDVFGNLTIEGSELRYRVQGREAVRTARLGAVREVDISGMENSQELIVRIHLGEREKVSDDLVIGASPRDTVRLLVVLRSAGFNAALPRKSH